MFRRENGRRIDDDFSHEQSLIFDTREGLVIFNSCSHAGADNIIKEVSAAFPGKNIYAIFGGFHLYRSSDREIEALALRINETGIKHIITGHCTGDNGFAVLKSKLNGTAQQMYSGFIFEI